eukprot:9469050-Pyramimonas_sp.AAC.1
MPLLCTSYFRLLASPTFQTPSTGERSRLVSSNMLRADTSSCHLLVTASLLSYTQCPAGVRGAEQRVVRSHSLPAVLPRSGARRGPHLVPHPRGRHVLRGHVDAPPEPMAAGRRAARAEL